VKKTLAVTVAIALVLAIAAPVFAQEMTHNAEYKMDGSIDIEKQVGHLCNTGAEMKQTIKGEGEMTKVMDTVQVAGKITVSDAQDWVTAEDAVRNLTVTSVISLCAPAKSELGEVDLIGYLEDYWRENSPGWFERFGLDEDEALTWDNLEAEAEPTYLFWKPVKDWLSKHEGMVLHPTELYSMLNNSVFPAANTIPGTPAAGDPIDMLNSVAWHNYVDPLTDQIWAVQVSADPGFSGALTQDFEAAYGPWEGHHSGLNEEDVSWDFDDDDDAALDDVVRGDDYVGNYFNIDQFARTSQGTTKRYISISSPWSHAYLMEDMEVVGMAEITESFSMDNIAPGEEAVPDWWELF